MSETLGEIHRAAVLIVEQHRIPATECRRSDADVDDDVEHRPTQAGHVFRLAWRQFGEVQPPQHPRRRHRTVGLAQVEHVTGERTELLLGEPLEEKPAVIDVKARRYLPRPRHSQLTNRHLTARVRRTALRRLLSTAPTTSRCAGTSRLFRAGRWRSRYALAPNTIPQTTPSGRSRNANHGQRDRPDGVV